MIVRTWAGSRIVLTRANIGPWLQGWGLTALLLLFPEAHPKDSADRSTAVGS